MFRTGQKAEGKGLELPLETPEKHAVCNQGGAQSGAQPANAVCQSGDAELRVVEQAWPHLTAEARRRIMAVVEECHRKQRPRNE